jgi:hypothetical protein
MSRSVSSIIRVSNINLCHSAKPFSDFRHCHTAACPILGNQRRFEVPLALTRTAGAFLQIRRAFTYCPGSHGVLCTGARSAEQKIA